MNHLRLLLLNFLLVPLVSLQAADVSSARPFVADFPNLDSLATGEWWTKNVAPDKPNAQPPPPPMDVPRKTHA